MTITETHPAPGPQNDDTTPSTATADSRESAGSNEAHDNDRSAHKVGPDETTTSNVDGSATREARTGPARPSWLPNGCPPWCHWPDDHNEHDHYNDRIHIGGHASVVMTVAQDRELYLPTDEAPSELRGSLYQHFREIEPHVEITRDGRATDLQLTLDEAESFAHQVLHLVATGRAGQPGTRIVAECPAWCHEHEDDAHVSTDRATGPFLARLYGTAETPAVDLAQDARRNDSKRPLTVAEAEELGLTLLGLAADAQAEPGFQRTAD
ncbi:DUF6907 domain-containing protein [Spirillospora sp. CA-253888]